MPQHRSPALQRFDRFLAEQRQFLSFLAKGQASINKSLQEFDMQETTQPSEIIEGQHFRVFQLNEDHFLWHWEGLGPYARWESDMGALTDAEARTLAQQELASLDLDTQNLDFTHLLANPDICPFKLNGDFMLEQADDGRWHWEGVTGTDCEECCSADGFASDRFAVADGIFQLSLLVHDCSREEAMFRVYQQGLPVHHLLESDD